MKNTSPNSLDGQVFLRDVAEEDLHTFFQQQLDPEANYMAAFTAENPSDRKAFSSHCAKLLADASVKAKTILYFDDVAGYIAFHDWFGDPEVTYWVGKEFWTLGIATKALSQFLAIMEERPIYARAVEDNIASIRVLERCGFLLSGKEQGYANARGKKINEVILRLLD